MGDICHLTPKIPAIERHVQLYMQATRPVKRKNGTMMIITTERSETQPVTIKLQVVSNRESISVTK